MLSCWVYEPHYQALSDYSHLIFSHPIVAHLLIIIALPSMAPKQPERSQPLHQLLHQLLLQLWTPPSSLNPRLLGRLGNSLSTYCLSIHAISPIRMVVCWIVFGHASTTLGMESGQSNRLPSPSRNMACMRELSWFFARKILMCVLQLPNPPIPSQSSLLENSHLVSQLCPPGFSIYQGGPTA